MQRAVPFIIAISGQVSVKTDLIDRIYECSFVPDLWPGVLEKTGCTRQAEVVSLLANVKLDRNPAKNRSSD